MRLHVGRPGWDDGFVVDGLDRSGKGQGSPARASLQRNCNLIGLRRRSLAVGCWVRDNRILGPLTGASERAYSEQYLYAGVEEQPRLQETASKGNVVDGIVPSGDGILGLSSQK